MDRASLEALFDRGMTPGALEAAQDYLDARVALQAAQNALQRAQKDLADAEAVLRRKAAESGTASVIVPGKEGDVLVTVSDRHYYRLPEGALEDVRIRTWLVKAGGVDLIRYAVDWKAFSGFCRRLVEQGRPVHPAVKDTAIVQVRVNNR